MFLVFVDNILDENDAFTDAYALFKQALTEGLDCIYLVNQANPGVKILEEKHSKATLRNLRGIYSLNPNNLNFIDRYVIKKANFILDAYQSIVSMGCYKFINIKKTKRIYVQHGINFFKTGFVSSDAITEQQYDFIFASNPYERHLIRDLFFYDSEQIINYLLPRILFSSVSNDSDSAGRAFIYLTYRNYCLIPSCAFLIENYIQQIKKIIKLLHKYGFEVRVGLHHVVREGLKNNIKNIPEINNILVDEFNIKEVKDASSLLITDFSSMAFDFLYRGKKVLFYNIDAGIKIDQLPENDAVGIKYAEKQFKDYQIPYLSNINQLEESIKSNKFFTNDNLCDELKSYKIKNYSVSHLIKKLTGTFARKNCYRLRCCEYEKYCPEEGNIYDIEQANVPFKFFGFSGIEKNGRWGGAGKTGIVFFLKNKLKKITLVFRMYGGKYKVFRKLKISVNGTVVFSKYIRTHRSCQEAIETESLGLSGSITIEFIVSSDMSPSEFGSDDHRLLSIFLEKVCN